MPLKQRPLRVLLAQLSPKNLPYLSDVISAESGIELIEVKDTPENIWKQVITRSPDITVFYAPIFEEAELRCINHILRGVYSRILVVTDETSVSKVPQDAKIEIFALNKDRVPNKALAEELVYRCKEIGPLKKTADPKAEPEAPAVSVSEADAPLMKHLIAIGASTGGTEALAQLFHMLPEHIPGIVVVQHMPPVFTRMYAERLNKELPFTVTEAADNVQIRPRCIYIAPGDRHLTVRKRGNSFYTALGGTEKVSGHCPSVDVLFESVASQAGSMAVGIILTGMGADGAQGLLRMRKAGAYTIGQDEASCVVYGMPKKAFEYGAVVKQTGLSDISKVLTTQLMKME